MAQPSRARVAVGALVEGLAAPVGREHVRLREDDVIARVRDHVHPAAERDAALAAAEPLHGQVQRHERGRARRVHADAGPAPAEEIGEAPAGRAVRRARAHIRLEVGQVESLDHDAEVELADADVHAAVAVAEPGRVDVRRLERLPRALEQQPVLRIDAGRFLRRDVEELGVEVLDAGDEAAARLDHLPFRAGLGRMKRRDVPAILRDRPGPRAAGAQELGELLRRLVVAGEAQAYAHDGDRLELLEQELPLAAVPTALRDCLVHV